MAPNSAHSVATRRKAKRVQRGEARKRLRPSSSAASASRRRKKTKLIRGFKGSSATKSLAPESNDPLEENILEGTPLPDEYVFVRKGDIYVTRNCRTKTKESYQVVYVVYNKAGRRVLGIGVPEHIHDEVEELADVTCKARAKAVQARDAKYLSHSEELLRTLFPAMPDDTVNTILNHSFLKGSGRVGRTATTGDKRKATLAVEAHIRHKHTPYESLLAAGTDRKDAREMVWPDIQATKKKWQEQEETDVEIVSVSSL